MRNVTLQLYRTIGFILLALLLIAVALIAIVTYENQNVSHPFLRYALHHHTGIMIGLMVISIAFGFVSSLVLYSAVQENRKRSQSILEIVLLFLSKEERTIMNYLVAEKGKTTQAAISKLTGLNRVKAFRSLQKMEEKQLIDIESHGKVRHIQLRENILRTLGED